MRVARGHGAGTYTVAGTDQLGHYMLSRAPGIRGNTALPVLHAAPSRVTKVSTASRTARRASRKK